MRTSWLFLALLLSACSDGPPAGPTVAIFDGQPSTANAPDLGESQADAGLFEDVYVPQETEVDDEQPVWPNRAVLTIEQTGASLTITWPEATGNSAVTAYSIYVDGQLVSRVDGAVRQYTHGDLVSVRRYVVVVIATDAAMNRSEPLSAQYDFVDHIAPVWREPSRAMVTNIRATAATIKWTQAIDNLVVVGYDLSVDGEVVTRVVDGTEHRLVDLTPLTTYAVSVKAIDAAGRQSQTALTVNFETTDDTAPDWAAEATLTAVQSGAHEVTLTWSEARDDRDATQYRIEENGVVLAQVAETRWQRSMLATPARYTYVVWAVDSSGRGSETPLQAVVDAADRTPPEWPNQAVLRVTQVTGGEVSLEWDTAVDNDRISHYRVSWGESSRAVESERITIAGLSAATAYRFEVVAIDAAQNESEAALSVDVMTVDDAAPTWPEGTALTLNWTADGALDARWPEATDNVGVTGYAIRRNAGVEQQLGNVTAYRFDGLEAGVDHVIRVVAFDATGHRTLQPLLGTARRADAAAPMWPMNAAILASDLTETSVRLAWPRATDAGANLTYTLSWGEDSLSTNRTSVALDTLSPWTAYTFTLSVVDADGHAAATDLSLQLRTPDVSAPTFAPGDVLSAVEIGEDFAVLRWGPATDNFEVAEYRLSVDGTDPQILAADQTELLLENLDPWQTYAITLDALDLAGNQTAEPARLSFRTLDESAPWWPEPSVAGTRDLTSTSVTLTWPVAQDNVAVTGYVVQVDDAEVLLAAADASSLFISDLQPWRDYRIAVWAQDEAGASSPALEVGIFTPDTEVPVWPVGSSLMPSQIESTALTVNWPMAVDDVAVVGYRVFADGLQTGAVDGAQRSIRIEGLQPARMVLIELVAVDAAGNDSRRLALSVTTPDGGPPTWAERTLNWQSGLNHATLNWPAARDDVGVTGYRVVVNGEVRLETPQTNALLEGLTAGQTYDVRIDARDEAHHWSADGPTAAVATVERAYDGFRRLSRLEYNRAVAYLWQWVYGTDENPRLYCDVNQPQTRAMWCSSAPNGFQGWLSVVANLLRAYPEEKRVRGEHELGGGFRRVDQRLFDEHIGVWAMVAGTLAQRYANIDNYQGGGRPDGMLPRVQENRCGSELGPPHEYPDGYLAYARACYQNFVERFGPRALRRPMTADEFQRYMAFFDAVPETMPERFQFERQLSCWIEIHGARAAPRPLSWEEGDEDWCDQIDEARLPALHPRRYHLAQAMLDFIPVIMSHPSFLYHVEVGDEDGALTAHELANRLSFHFWRAPPDQELRSLADSGELHDEEVYAAQVDRLFADPRAEEGVRTFYDGYFWIESIPNFYEGDRAYMRAHKDWHPAYYRGLTPSWSLEQRGFGAAAQAELSNLGHYFTREQPGSYRDMFSSNLNFLECQTREGGDFCGSAGIFGMFVYETGNCADDRECRQRNWDRETETGYYPGDEPVEIPEPNRHGLITRIGFLMHETTKERPIRRGLKIRDMLLCDPIPPPENCDVVRVPHLSGLCAQDGVSTGRECSHNSHCGDGQVCEDPFRRNRLTVREVVEEITEVEGTSCATCHARWINGMGHALNNYSSQGLYRPQEPMLQMENVRSWGRWKLSTAMRPLEEWPLYDTHGAFQFEGEQYELQNAQELADFLVNSDRLESCWAQQYFRYTMGRLETPSDLVTIESLADQLRDGVSLAEVYKSIAFTDAFKSISKPAQQLSSEDSP